jgi:O-succinylbenzoic acid--CoA ligase
VHVEAWLPRAAALRPHATAVESAQGNATFSELFAGADAGASELAAHGVGRHDMVAIALPSGLQFAYALHATLLRGSIAVPVDPRLSPRERAAILEGAAFVIDAPLAFSAARGAGSESRHEHLRHDLNAPAALIYTSGTSAAAKPVALTYGNFLWSALGSAAVLGCEPGDRWLCPLPLAHVGGLSILVRSAIYATTAVLHDGFDTDRVVHALRRDEITLVSFVATTLTRVLDAGLRRPASLRCALTGGGPVSAELLARARRAGVPASATYGLTEACSQVATVPVAALDGPSPGGARPLFCTRVRIDANAGGTDPMSGSGEILVAGPTVAPGSVDADGWLHTGDLGLLDQDGCLRVTGRISETIISGGENVAPSEVEAVLEAYPGVAEAAVMGRSDSRWGQVVVAVVVPSPGIELIAEDVLSHCAGRLAAYKVPKIVLVRDRPLPRTHSGKLLRRELGTDDPACDDRAVSNPSDPADPSNPAGQDRR